MLAPIDPARLTPLIHGLPDSLKTYVANIQDRIQTARAMNAAVAAAQPPPEQVPVTTWSEFVREVVNYGWVGSITGKPPEPPRPVHQVHTTELKPEFKPKFDKERNDLWHKALALGVPGQPLYGTSTTNLRTLVQSLSQRSIQQGEVSRQKMTDQFLLDLCLRPHNRI